MLKMMKQRNISKRSKTMAKNLNVAPNSIFFSGLHVYMSSLNSNFDEL